MEDRETLCRELNVATRGRLNLVPADLVEIEGEWTLDGMDPWEWCEAMLMN
jgi:hypothetical protein